MASINDRRWTVRKSDGEKVPTGYTGPKPWRARYRPDKTANEVSQHFARKVDAQNWLDSVTADLQRGEHVDRKRGRQTFGAWADQWLARVGPPEAQDGRRL